MHVNDSSRARLIQFTPMLGFLGSSRVADASSTGQLRLLGLLIMAGAVAGVTFALLFVSGPSKTPAHKPGLPYRVLFALLALGVVIKLFFGSRGF